MRAAWKTIKTLTSKPKNVGGLPGMVAVLHTFGSDMGYHIHVHTLVTFGGIDNQGQWQWPKHKNKLAPYREISKEFRDIFLAMLNKAIKKNEIVPVENMERVIQEMKNKRWNVRNEYPTANTEVLQRYLARYINRVAISKSRLEYVANQQKINDQVNITYKDYREKVKGQPTPFAIKSIQPLVAINQFLSHVLPPYFQKSRHYGIHSSVTFKRIEHLIPNKLKRNSDTVRLIFRILKFLAGLKPKVCEKCHHHEFSISPLKADVKWIFNFITIPSYRAPPMKPNSARLEF